MADVQEPSGEAQERPLPPTDAEVLASLDFDLVLSCGWAGCPLVAEYLFRCTGCGVPLSGKVLCDGHADRAHRRLCAADAVRHPDCGLTGDFHAVFVREDLSGAEA